MTHPHPKDCACEHEHDHEHSPLNLLQRWILSLLMVGILLIFVRPFIISQMLVRVTSYSTNASYTDAIRVCKKIIAIDKDNIQAWTSLGYTYMDLSQTDSAINAFDHVLVINPQDKGAASYELARAYFAKGDYTRAIEYFQRVRSAGPRAAVLLDADILKYRHGTLGFRSVNSMETLLGLLAESFKEKAIRLKPHWPKKNMKLIKISIVGYCFSVTTIVLGLTPAFADKVNVVSTISIIGDVVKNVAKDAANLAVLVGPDGDAHEYEPIPADSVSIARANIIFENGLHLEHWLDKLYSASGSKAKRIIVTRGVVPRIFENNPQEIDPHAWQDVANVIIYTKNVRDALEAVDPANKVFYEANARDYVKKLQALDTSVKEQVAKIPVDKRKLVTNHDALGYFARAYGFRIIGAVIPSATTEASDPSAQQTVQLLGIIKSNGVHAIFSENMANPQLAQALSNEAGVVLGPALYTDALGPPGGPGESYLKMIEHNVKIFVEYLK